MRFLNKLASLKTIAAIDLGSNALRAVIARESSDKLEVIQNIRIPLRLGEDVFRDGVISQKKFLEAEEAFVELFHEFVKFDVKDLRAMATSAMRDAKNGSELSKSILQTTGIDLEIISGDEEAQIIFDAVKGQVPLSKKIAILMDIGGGSTEITIVKLGKIVAAHSFNIGTVRLLQYKDKALLEETIKEQVGLISSFIRKNLLETKPNLIIGTGGNLRRIGKIRKKTLNKLSSEVATFEEITQMKDIVFSMSYVERIRDLELDQNKADVILPAITLTHLLMEQFNLKEIKLPKVGLKEGILLTIAKKDPKNFILRD